MKKLLTLTGVLALSAAMPAHATDKMSMDSKAAMMTKHCMMKMDTNGDGMVSKEEHEAASEKMFTDADTNSDGSLSKDEIMAAKKKEMSEMMAMKSGSKGMKSTKMMHKPTSDVDSTGHNDMGVEKGATSKNNAETH